MAKFWAQKNSRVSIAIASYNGVKWIGTQLDSIRAQTLTPDEVIINDDCSTDGTYEFCEKYIRDYELEGWKVYRNEDNVGVSKNFRLALSKCTGDYVFTCDQDDEWLPDKIQVMVKTLEDYPEIRLLISNYIPTYNGKLMSTNTLKNLGRNDGEVVQYRLENHWIDPVRPGCTYCFRREMIDMFNEFDIEEIYHDAMLWIYAVVSDSLYLINRQLSYWKRHDEATTGIKLSAYPTISERIEWITRDEKTYSKILNAHEKLYISRQNQKLLRDKLSFMERRKKMLATRNLFRAAIFVMMNLKFYPTFRNALSDIYAMIFLR